jgi:hypothetical protein
VRSKTLKLSKKSIKETLQEAGIAENFLNRSVIPQAIEARA